MTVSPSRVSAPNRNFQFGSNDRPISARSCPMNADDSPITAPSTRRSPFDIGYTSSAPDPWASSMISSAVSASGSMITSAPIVASSRSPSGPRSSSVWIRTTVCSTPNSFASSDARRLTSSFCVTPASRPAFSIPAARNVDGTAALPTTTCTSSSAPIAAAMTSFCSTTTMSLPSAPRRWARYQPTSPAPTITTCMTTACPIGPTDREHHGRRRRSGRHTGPAGALRR